MIDKKKASNLFAVVVRPIQEFFCLEAATGVLLLAAAVAALVLANSPAAAVYQSVLEFPLTVGIGTFVSRFSLAHLINDGLMAVFFLVVGLEIKRELAIGELSSPSKAALPAVAALGGMVVPSGIFLAFNMGQPGQVGWGIPMATDIAFCIGCLTLLRSRVPHALIVFVTALAIFDDIGGILVIALFYGHGLAGRWIAAAFAITAVLYWMNRRYVRNGLAYGAMGAALWYALHEAGIHATISGVILGLMVPARPRRPGREVLSDLAQHTADLLKAPSSVQLDDGDILAIEERLEEMEAPLTRFVHVLHPYVAFLIMPAFALANAGVSLHGVGLTDVAGPVAMGTALGLVLGKLVGVFGATFIAVKLGLSPIPGQASWTKLAGVSAVAGIGFTVALFIASLAFTDAPALLDQAKIGILLGSLVAGVLGCAVLRATAPIVQSR